MTLQGEPHLGHARWCTSHVQFGIGIFRQAELKLQPVRACYRGTLCFQPLNSDVDVCKKMLV